MKREGLTFLSVACLVWFGLARATSTTPEQIAVAAKRELRASLNYIAKLLPEWVIL